MSFSKTTELQLQTFVDNAVSLTNASEYRNIAPSLNLYHIRSGNMSTQALLNMMSKLAGVEHVEPNYIYRATVTPNDTRVGQLWGMNNTGQVVSGQTGVAGADISAVQAWDVSTGSTSIVVGVIDTGVDYNHPDLAANIWSAPAAFSVTVGGRTINCPAGRMDTTLSPTPATRSTTTITAPTSLERSGLGATMLREWSA